MMFNFVPKSFCLITLIVGLVFLQSCTSLPPVNPSVITAMQNAENIVTISRKAGKLTMLTPLGITAEDLALDLPNYWSTGRKLIHRYNIINPNEIIKAKFMNSINNGRKISRFIDIQKPLSLKESTLSNLKGKYISGFALIFSHGPWEIEYLVHDQNHYQMLFNASVDFVRIEDMKIIWSSKCSTIRDEKELHPTLQELLAEDSQVLNDWLDKATSQCSKQFVYNFPK